MTASAEAKAWIDALESGRGACGAWRLELLDQRTRVPRGSDSDSASSVVTLPAKIRRSADGLPRSLVDAAVRYLVSLSPYSGIVYEGEEIEGEYVPVRTTWSRDRGMNGRDGTYTLTQDLVRTDLAADAVGAVTQSACSSVQTTEWRWDEPSVEPAPESGQGVVSGIQGVSRNEDGTLDYALFTRTAVTRDSGWATQSCDAYSTVHRRTWDGVYGTPDAPAPGGGGSWESPPPEPCEARGDDGTLLKVEWRQDEDCTWRVEAERTVPNRVDGAQESVRRTLSGVVRSVRSVNVPAEGASLPDPASMAPGSSFEAKLSENGLYETEAVAADPVPFGGTGASATQTAFRTEAERRSNTTLESASDLLDVDLEGAPSGAAVRKVELSDGVVRTVEARITEAGTVDVAERAAAERPVRNAQRSARRTLTGVVVTTLDRSQDPSSVDFAAETAALTPGSSIEVRTTDGGLVDVERASAQDVSVGQTGLSATQTAFRTDAETRRNVPFAAAEEELGESLAIDLSGVPAGVAVSKVALSDGVVRTVEARVTDNGTVDISERAAAERPVRNAQRSARRTLTGVVVTTLDRSQDPSSVDFAAETDALAPGGSVEVRTTDGGLVDVERTLAGAKPFGETGQGRRLTALQSESRVMANVAEESLSDHWPPERDGRHVAVTGTMERTENGTVNVTVATTEDVDVDGGWRQRKREKTLSGCTVTDETRMCSAPLTASTGDTLGVGDAVDYVLTETGNYERRLHKVDFSGITYQYRGWEASATPTVTRKVERVSYPPEFGGASADTNHPGHRLDRVESSFNSYIRCGLRSSHDQTPGSGYNIAGTSGQVSDCHPFVTAGVVQYFPCEGVRVSRTCTREADGSYLVEQVTETEKRVASASDPEFSDPVVSYEFKTPLSLVFVRNYERLTSGMVKEAYAKVQAAVDEWNSIIRSGQKAASANGTVQGYSKMGGVPSNVMPSIETSRDAYGLWNVHTSITVQWPAGSGGPDGSLGDTLFWDASIADTVMGAGRGATTLANLINRYAQGSVDQIGIAYQQLCNRYLRMVAQALRIEGPGITVQDIDTVETWPVARPTVSMDTTTGQWTASYVKQSAFRRIDAMAKLLSRGVNILYNLMLMQSLTSAADNLE